jgi:hypothetical protein
LPVENSRSARLSVIPKPLSLSNNEWDPDEGFWFFFSGEPDQSFQIQLSDNLVDWSDVFDVCPTTGYFWINDGDAIYCLKNLLSRDGAIHLI